jgi:exoribonuclease R
MTLVRLRKLVWTVASADDRFDSIIRHSTRPFERAAADKRLSCKIERWLDSSRVQ